MAIRRNGRGEGRLWRSPWARSIRNLRRSRADATLPDEMMSSDQFWWFVELELERSRRNDRTFALSALDMTSAGPAALTSLTDRLLPKMRAIDAVTAVDGIVLLLLSEADRDAASIAVDRLLAEVESEIAPALVHTVVFPHDSFSVDALLTRLTDGVDDAAPTDIDAALRRSLPTPGRKRRKRTSGPPSASGRRAGT